MLINDVFIAPFREEKCLIAVVVTTKKWIQYAFETKGELTDERAEEIAHRPRFCDWVRKDLRELARAEALPHGAYLAAVRATIVPFENDESLHTPTGKQRPAAFIEKFAGELAAMRAEVVSCHRRKKLAPDEIEDDDEKDDPPE
jgi:hypothetical protein